MAGWDLNRRWAEPSPYLSPVIYTAKNLARIVQSEREIVCQCDMHGHFQPHGTFMYCNSWDRGEGQGVATANLVPSAELRMVPYLLTGENKYFGIRHCTFNMEAYKEGSARQVFFNEFKINQSFTLENSFFKKYTDKELEWQK